jgi:hypothetical protein
MKQKHRDSEKELPDSTKKAKQMGTNHQVCLSRIAEELNTKIGVYILADIVTRQK